MTTWLPVFVGPDDNLVPPLCGLTQLMLVGFHLTIENVPEFYPKSAVVLNQILCSL